MLYNCERIFFILSFFVGYILSFGLVWLRTFRLSTRVGAHIERRCSRSHGQDVTISDVIIKPRIGNRTGDMNEIMPGNDGLGFLGILKKAVGWDFEIGRSESRSELKRGELIFGAQRGEARPGQASWGLQDAPLVVGLDGTVSIVRIVSLSPRVENLKVKKVIKVSYLNQDIVMTSSVFRGIPMHVNIFTYLYISRIHIMAILQKLRKCVTLKLSLCL